MLRLTYLYTLFILRPDRIVSNAGQFKNKSHVPKKLTLFETGAIKWKLASFDRVLYTVHNGTTL